MADEKYVPNMYDWVVCTVKSAWYAVSDRVRLWYGRMTWVPSDQITVVIPTRNRWQLLEDRALASLGAQTLEPFSVLVIDDGSDPMALPGLYYIKGRPLRIEAGGDKVINYPNTAWGRWCAGPVQAMNYARKFLKNGGWVLRMDDDDVLRPDALEKLLAWAKNEQVELVSARHNSKGLPVTPYRLRDHVIGGIQTTLCKAYVARLPYNRDCWRKSWDCMNDVDWVVRAVEAGVKTSYLPEVVCDIDPRPGQTETGWLAQQTEYAKGE